MKKIVVTILGIFLISCNNHFEQKHNILFISIDDLRVPKQKNDILANAEKEVTSLTKMRSSKKIDDDEFLLLLLLLVILLSLF